MRSRPRPKIIMKKYQIMISNIWFKIIAGKINKIPEFYTIFARKIPVYIMRQRDGGQAEAKTSSPRPGRGQSFEAEAKILASRPLWPRGVNMTAPHTDWFSSTIIINCQFNRLVPLTSTASAFQLQERHAHSSVSVRPRPELTFTTLSLRTCLCKRAHQFP